MASILGERMKVAIIGSRSITIDNIGKYIPDDTTEIVSGGAIGVDTCASEYAKSNSIKLTEFKPDYSRYGRYAPLKRNDTIILYSDLVIAFWDGKSKGTAYVINKCKELSKPCIVHRMDDKHQR